MKTAIVLSLPCFVTFRFDLLKHPEQVRFIGIFTEQDAAKLPESHRTGFAEIHVVPNGVADPDPMLSPMVEYEATRAVVKKVIEGLELRDVFLLSYYEWNLLTAAKIRDELGIAGPSYDQILPYRDKLLMKERLVAANVRVPKFGHYHPARYVEDARGYFERIKAEVGLPFILKPVDSAGADGVWKITSLAEFLALPPAFGRGYEYEEFITGTMYSVNLVTDHGKTVFGGVTEYQVNTFELLRGRINTDLNLLDSDPRVARMVRFAESALDALGRLDGGSHMEIFLTPADELVFLEVGARFKGVFGLSAMQRNYAIAFVNLSFQIETGLESHPYDGKQIYCFDGVFPKKRGKVAKLVPPPLESEHEVTWKVAVGDVLEPSVSLVDSTGMFLVWNHDFEALKRDFERFPTYEPVIYEHEL